MPEHSTSHLFARNRMDCMHHEPVVGKKAGGALDKVAEHPKAPEVVEGKKAGTRQVLRTYMLRIWLSKPSVCGTCMARHAGHRGWPYRGGSGREGWQVVHVHITDSSNMQCA
jgi:hypothetical protein